MSVFAGANKKRSKKTLSCTAVIAAAGSSQRMDGVDKLFADINGKPVLAYALEAFQSCGYVDDIIIVAREEKYNDVSDICKAFGIYKASKIIFGGPTRLLSVMNGVFAVSKKADLIAIHDGARPCVDAGAISRTIESASASHAAAPAIPIISTVKDVRNNIIKETVDRDGLYEIQTPQVFSAALIRAALKNANDKSIDVTDDCYAVELLGVPVRIVEGARANIKLTTSEDFMIAEAILCGRASPALSFGAEPRVRREMI